MSYFIFFLGKHIQKLKENMGRLTDDILAMIGVKPSDRVSAAKTPNNIEIPEIPLMFPTREQIVNGIEEAEKPEDEEDCLSCKVVGCSVLCGAAGAILYAVKRNSPHFTGRKLHLYRAQGGSVAGGESVVKGITVHLDICIHHAQGCLI